MLSEIPEKDVIIQEPLASLIADRLILGSFLVAYVMRYRALFARNRDDVAA